MKHLIILMCAVFAISGATRAALKSQTIEYKDGDTNTTLRGYLVYDDSVQGRRPGVLVIPEWWGLNDYARRRADQLAQLGYVALAADMYGDGKVTTEVKQAGQWATVFRSDRALMRQRAQAALDALKTQPQVDPAKLAGIGYCFGGTVVLELARSGADLLGVVSFHGGLDTPMPAEPGKVRARVLVLTGGADPNVPPEQVEAFESEMKKAGVSYRVVSYPGAVHAFTNPDADRLGLKGIGYNKEADEKSWEEMKRFLPRSSQGEQ